MAVTGGTNTCLAPGLGDWNALEVTGFCSDVATAHGSPQLIGKEAFGQLPGFGSTRALPHSLFTLMECDVTCWNPGSSQQSGRKKELETTGARLEAARSGSGRRWPGGGSGTGAEESSPSTVPRGGGVSAVYRTHSTNAGSARGDMKIHGFKQSV